MEETEDHQQPTMLEKDIFGDSDRSVSDSAEVMEEIEPESRASDEDEDDSESEASEDDDYGKNKSSSSKPISEDIHLFFTRSRRCWCVREDS
jgi:hypothetical protein